jgi:hypothetical protein
MPPLHGIAHHRADLQAISSVVARPDVPMPPHFLAQPEKKEEQIHSTTLRYPQPPWNEVATTRIWRRRRKRLTRRRRGAAEAPAAGTAKGAKRSVGGWIYRRGNDFGARRRAGGILCGGFGLIARRARSQAVASVRRGMAREIDFLENTETVGRLFCCVFYILEK